jgi:hypothetical protein
MAKIRAGFVSNSSSSSFVLVFPKDMTPEQFIKKHEEEILDWVMECGLYGWEYDDSSEAQTVSDSDKERILGEVKSSLIPIFDGGHLSSWDDDDNMYGMLSSINTHEYQVTRIETGPDDGSIIILDRLELIEKLGVNDG